jgi:hypothetical protein
VSRGARDVGKRRGPAVDAEPPRTGNGGAGGFHPTPSPTFTRSETATGGNGDERYGDERYGGASDVGTGGGDGGGASAGCGLWASSKEVPRGQTLVVLYIYANPTMMDATLTYP